MSKKGKDKVAANLPAPIITAIEAGARQGALVPTIEQYADTECNIIDTATVTRCNHWVTVFGAYKHSIPDLERYPQAVRHAYAAKLGLNMKVRRAEWTHGQRKLYESFCANQVSPLVLMLKLAIGTKDEKGEGIDKVIGFLKGEGSLPAKITQARAMLGKPVKPRGTKNTGNHGEASTAASKASDGAQKWDMTDLRTKQPIEVVCQLIPFFKIPELVTTVQAVVAKLKTSADPVEMYFASLLSDAVKKYDEKNDEDTGEDTSGTDEDGKIPAAATA